MPAVVSTPAEVCQLGAASVLLTPPPVPPEALCGQVVGPLQLQAVSPTQVPPLVDSVVPPMAIT